MSLVDTIWRSQIGVSVVDGAALWEMSAVAEVSGENFKLKIEDRLEQTDLHPSAFAAYATANQARQQSLNQVSAGKHVCYCETEGHRRLVGIPIQPWQS